MPDVKRQVKVVTEQHVIDKPELQPGYPMRAWTIKIFLTNGANEDLPATLFDKAVYHLHATFGDRAIQTIKQPPFQISEEGWGEFDMQIKLTGKFKGGEHTLDHDLNFQSERYESKHTITFRNPKPELLRLLEETGGAGGAGENGVKGKADGKKKARKDRNVDMEKLADGLQKLTEDDLLHVVQLVHDNKTADTYTKNDIEAGEFHVDLYTLPDNLVKMLNAKFVVMHGAAEFCDLALLNFDGVDYATYCHFGVASLAHGVAQRGKEA